MFITADILRYMGLCESGIIDFENLFPKGCKINIGNIQRCIEQEIDVLSLMSEINGIDKKEIDNMSITMDSLDRVCNKFGKSKQGTNSAYNKLSDIVNSESAYCIWSDFVIPFHEEIIEMIDNAQEKMDEEY